VSKTFGYLLWLKTARRPGTWAVAPFPLKGSPARRGSANTKQKNKTKQTQTRNYSARPGLYFPYLSISSFNFAA
jgi:hypothetical protein